MKKLSLLVCASALVLATPAFAQSANDEAIKSDVNSVNKDNKDIQQNQADTQADRNAKAADKANGNYGSQAVDSVKIGADKTVGAVDSTKQSYHKKMLQHHKANATTDNGDAATSTSTSNSSN